LTCSVNPDGTITYSPIVPSRPSFVAGSPTMITYANSYIMPESILTSTASPYAWCSVASDYSRYPSQITPLSAVSSVALLPQPFSATEFLTRVYMLANDHNPRPGIGFVFSQLNHLLAGGDTSTCDHVLASVDTDSLSADLLLAFLTITFPGRDRLPSRKGYYVRARRKLRKDVGWCEARRLLAALD
jgi:hypothetical protein